MKFKQNEDGSCDIEFSENEIKIIQDKKKLYMDSRSFKNFGNILIKMVAEWQLKFDNTTKKLVTYGNDTEDPDVNKY